MNADEFEHYVSCPYCLGCMVGTVTIPTDIVLHDQAGIRMYESLCGLCDHIYRTTVLWDWRYQRVHVENYSWWKYQETFVRLGHHPRWNSQNN